MNTLLFLFVLNNGVSCIANLPNEGDYINSFAEYGSLIKSVDVFSGQINLPETSYKLVINGKIEEFYCWGN